MATGSSFPASLDSFNDKVDSVDDILAVETNKQSSAIEKLQEKVGIDGSIDTDSLTYKVDNVILTDPTTSQGDIIVRGAVALEGLAVGTASQFLISDGTDPTWGTAIDEIDVGNINIASNDITSTSGDINITPIAGSKVSLDGSLSVDGDSIELSATADIYTASGEWQDWTPTLDGKVSMTFTGTSIANARYKVLGKIVFIWLEFSGTLGGTASNGVKFTLPVAPKTYGTDSMPIFSAIIRNTAVISAIATFESGSTVQVNRYDVANLSLDTCSARVQGWYEIE